VRERDSAIRVRRQEFLRDTNPEASASAHAETLRPQGLCAAEIFSEVEGYDVEPSNFGDTDIVFQKCKAYHWMDERLKSSSDGHPLFSIFCGSGAVDLPAFPDPPEPLRAWALGGTAQDRKMAKNLRLLKNCHGPDFFTGKSPPPSPGGSAWETADRLHVKRAHYAGLLRAAEGREASFLHAFFLYSEDNGERLAPVCRAVAHRRGGQVGFVRIPVSEPDATSRRLFDAVQMFSDMLLGENKLVMQFSTARERVQEIEDTTGRPVPSVRVVVHANAVPEGFHVRVYNDAESTKGEVSTIVPQSDLDVPSMPEGTGHSGDLKRDVILMVRAPPGCSGAATQTILRKVSFVNSWFDPTRFPLIFPLIFPLGTYDYRCLGDGGPHAGHRGSWVSRQPGHSGRRVDGAAAKTWPTVDPPCPPATRVAHEMRASCEVVVGAAAGALEKALTGSPAGAPSGGAVETPD